MADRAYRDEDEYVLHVQVELEALGWKTQNQEHESARYVPDVSFSANGIDGWLEVKYVKVLPKTLGSIKHYTKGQQQWLIDFGKAGAGHCYVLLGSPGKHVLFKYHQLKLIRDMPLEEAIGKHKWLMDWTLEGLAEQMNRYVRGQGARPVVSAD